jgi:hypothetical protein
MIVLIATSFLDGLKINIRETCSSITLCHHPIKFIILRNTSPAYEIVIHHLIRTDFRK